MASIFEQYGIKEVADVTFYERDTAGHEKPVLYIDTAKVSTIEKTASTAEARGGKGNPALISWDFGLEINVTLEDALFSPKSMAIMQGAGKVESASTSATTYIDVINEIYEFPASSSTAASRSTITLKHDYVDNSIYIYEIDDNGRWTSGEQLRGWKRSGTSTNVITKGTTTGTEINTQKVAVFYKTPINGVNGTADVIHINSDTFPGTYRVVGDTFARNRSTGKDEFFQFIIHRAKVSPENTITLSADGDPSTFNMSLKVLRNIGNSGMIDLVKYNFASGDETTIDLGPSDTNPA
jgi:hypothetical protein